MDEGLIKKIVVEVFKKAKTKSASHSRYALSKEVESESRLSHKTVERSYNKYISKINNEDYTPNADSVDQFCVYIGYRDYADYVAQNSGKEKTKEKQPGNNQPLKKNPNTEENYNEYPIAARKIWQFIGITAFLVTCILIIAYFNYSKKDSDSAKIDLCMTWTGRFYEKIPCSKGTYSTYGNAIEPYDEKRYENFKRVEVDITTSFFSEQNRKPLFWYYKSKQGEIEYYTAPGLHPVNGKTLRAVTEYIVEKYVPIHRDNPSSFVNE